MKAMRQNIVLVDYASNQHEEARFIKALNQNGHGTWIVKRKVTNNLHGGILKNLLRFMLYFLFPLSIVLKLHKFNKIIGWQQFYGLNVAFFLRLFHLKKTNEIYVMTFIYKKKKGLAGSLYHKYMNYVVTSKYVDKFICFAKEEVEYYNSIFDVSNDKFVYLPLGLKPIEGMDISDEGFVFAAGRSNRNYDFLIDVLSESHIETKIVCDTYHNSRTEDNIRIFNDCHGDSMLQIMAKCHIVVVPLDNVLISSGQLVVLQAMALGKPVICTDSKGISDYVVNCVTGFLIDNVKDIWLSKIEALYKDEKLYNETSIAAKSLFNERFTDEIMYRNIAKIVG